MGNTGALGVAIAEQRRGRRGLGLGAQVVLRCQRWTREPKCVCTGQVDKVLIMLVPGWRFAQQQLGWVSSRGTGQALLIRHEVATIHEDEMGCLLAMMLKRATAM